MSLTKKKQYKCITYSGTFDHLHIGHKQMIELAAQLAEKVIIGLTTQPMTVRKKLSHLIQPYNVRLKEIELFLKLNKIDHQVSIEPIEDKYGFALTNPILDAILISSEIGPRKNAEAINEAREKQNLVPLAIVSSPYILSKDSDRVSSFRIRAGEMTSNGNLLRTDKIRDDFLDLMKQDIVLPDHLRHAFKDPFGRLFEGLPRVAGQHLLKWLEEEKIEKVIAIGDVVTNTLIALDYAPQIFVIDYKTKRHAIPTSYYPTVHSFHVNNPPAQITKDAVMALYFANDLSGNTKIIVQGEEDLLALPAQILARPGTVIIYGQPSQGIVAVNPDKKQRMHVLTLLNQFDKSED